MFHPILLSFYFSIFLNIYGLPDDQNNCENYIAASTPDQLNLTDAAKPNLELLQSMMSNLIIQGLFVLDSDMSLLHTSPAQRSAIAKLCHTWGWFPSLEGQEQCVFKVAKIEKVSRRSGEPPKLQVHVKISNTTTSILFYLQSKTDKARRCFDKIHQEGLVYPTDSTVIPPELIRKARETKTSIESIVFNHIDKDSIKNILFKITKTKDKPSNPQQNINFDVSLSYFAPDDGESKFHTKQVTALVTSFILSQIAKTPDLLPISQFLMFGIRVIYLSSLRNRELVDAIKKLSRSAGNIKLYSATAENEIIPHASGNLRDLIQLKENTTNFPLVSYQQIFIIGGEPGGFAGFVHLSDADAFLLAKRVTTVGRSPTLSNVDKIALPGSSSSVEASTSAMKVVSTLTNVSKITLPTPLSEASTSTTTPSEVSTSTTMSTSTIAHQVAQPFLKTNDLKTVTPSSTKR